MSLSVYQEQKDDTKSQENLINGEGTDLNLHSKPWPCLPLLFLVISHNWPHPHPPAHTPFFLLSLAEDSFKLVA